MTLAPSRIVERRPGLRVHLQFVLYSNNQRPNVIYCLIKISIITRIFYPYHFNIPGTVRYAVRRMILIGYHFTNCVLVIITITIQIILILFTLARPTSVVFVIAHLNLISSKGSLAWKLNFISKPEVTSHDW